MPYNTNSELCFQVPYQRINEVIDDIETIGVDTVVPLVLEDFKDRDPTLYKGILFLAENMKTDNYPQDQLRQVVLAGSAISYFATTSYCTPKHERHLAPLSGIILTNHAENQAKGASGLYRFFTSYYYKDEALRTIFRHLEWDDSSATSALAQIGGGAVTFYLNEFETRCREASNN